MAIFATLSAFIVALFPGALLLGQGEAHEPEIVLESVHATIAATEASAVTELDLVLRNHARRDLEESFLWPVPEDAAVSSLELWIDGKPAKGELLSKEAARQAYDEVVRRRRDPAILEWTGRGCVRASIFPVPPGAAARVRVRFASALQAAGATASGLLYELPLRASALAPAGLRSLVN